MINPINKILTIINIHQHYVKDILDVEMIIEAKKELSRLLNIEKESYILKKYDTIKYEEDDSRVFQSNNEW